MGLTLITAATSDPVTKAQVTALIEGYQSSTANDLVVTDCIADATAWVQEQTRLQLIQATWLQSLGAWPDELIEFDLRPLISITNLKYYDVNGSQQTVSSADYGTDTYAYRPTLWFKSSFTWPELQLLRPSGIECRFVAGFADASSVPGSLKRAIRLLARYWWEKRQAATVPDSQQPTANTNTYGEIPFGVWSIVNNWNASGYT